MQEDLPQAYFSGLPSRRRGTARHHNTVSEAARGHFAIDDQAATPFAAFPQVLYGFVREHGWAELPRHLIRIQAGRG